MLTPAQISAYGRSGYLVLENWFSAASARDLREHAATLAHSCRMPARPAVFSTRSHAHASTRYFLDSAQDVCCFLEEEALDDNGKPLQPVESALNKIGHALHRRDPVFQAFSHEPRVLALVSALGLAAPAPVQSMLIFKPPRIGGEVVWHQDASFLYTEPSSVVGLWFALEPASVDNGCLWVLPGQHQHGLKRRFVRTGDAVRFVEQDERPWQTESAVPVEVNAGTLVVLHGLLPHRSEANRSDRSRVAYALHFVDDQCRYAPDNWLRRPGANDGSPPTVTRDS